MVISTLPSQPSVNLPPPSPVPEGYVEFYYQASFTFLGGETSSISNVELWLPWPYIDTKETRPIAKPVGLDNWLHIDNGFISMRRSITIGRLVYDYYKNALNLKNNEVTAEENENEGILDLNINVENGIWTTNRPVDYTVIENLEITYDSLPTSVYLNVANGTTMLLFQKIVAKLSSMSIGNTFSIKYRFLVSKENSEKIRVDDWLYSYDYVIYMKKPLENAPAVAAMYDGPPISCEFTVSLHKNIGGNWEKVAYYKRKWDSWRTGFGLVTNS